MKPSEKPRCRFCNEELEDLIDVASHICLKPRTKWKTKARNRSTEDDYFKKWINEL